MDRINPKADDWHPGEAFVESVFGELVPKVDGAQFFLSLCPRDGGPGDVKFWVELGLAIMYDKPIVAIVPARTAREVPRKLRRVADEIVYAPDGLNDEVAQALQAAMARLDLSVQ